MSLIKAFALKLGIDKSIFFTSLARVIQAVGGVVSILFVARYLTGIEQGFYYTFGSIVAIQIFFRIRIEWYYNSICSSRNSASAMEDFYRIDR